MVAIGIPAYDGVDLLDMTGPYEMFHWARFEIDVLATSPGLKASGSGFSFRCSWRLAIRALFTTATD